MYINAKIFAPPPFPPSKKMGGNFTQKRAKCGVFALNMGKKVPIGLKNVPTRAKRD